MKLLTLPGLLMFATTTAYLLELPQGVSAVPRLAPRRENLEPARRVFDPDSLVHGSPSLAKRGEASIRPDVTFSIIPTTSVTEAVGKRDDHASSEPPATSPSLATTPAESPGAIHPEAESTATSAAITTSGSSASLTALNANPSVTNAAHKSDASQPSNTPSSLNAGKGCPALNRPGYSLYTISPASQPDWCLTPDLGDYDILANGTLFKYTVCKPCDFRQLWAIRLCQDGETSIFYRDTDFAVDSGNWPPANSAYIRLWKYGPYVQQNWFQYPHDATSDIFSFHLRNATDYYLDLTMGQISPNPSPLQIWTGEGNSNEQWKLRKFDAGNSCGCIP